jgi:hypothetical protein
MSDEQTVTVSVTHSMYKLGTVAIFGETYGVGRGNCDIVSDTTYVCDIQVPESKLPRL